MRKSSSETTAAVSDSVPVPAGAGRGETFWSVRSLSEAALLFGLAFAARILATGLVGEGVGPGPDHDELYHLLAARSWVEDGTLDIAGGQYSRGFAYTISLGWLFSLFGESETIARLVNILIGSLSVVALFLWTGWVAGRSAAWIAAVLMCLSPDALFLSGFIRFYAAHALVFWLGAIGCYTLVTRRMATSATLAVLAGTGVALILAVHLQIITLIGLVGLAGWASIAVVSGSSGWSWTRSQLMRLAWVMGALFVLAVTVAIVSGLAATLFDAYRSVALWNAGDKDNVLYYHYYFLDQYPTLWTLLPLAAFVALARRPQAVLFCVTIFAVAIVLHSIAGMKWARYIYYVLPFFFSFWGIVFADTFPAVEKRVSAGVDRILKLGAHHPFGTVARWASVAAIVAFLIASNSAIPGAFRMMLGQGYATSPPAPPWTAARQVMQPWLDSAEVVLTTDGLRSLYYFDRFDVEINESLVDEIDTGAEFGIDPRTGRPVIGKAESIARVLACHSSGLFVGESRRWRRGTTGIDNAGADLLVARTRPIAVPKEWGLIARIWEHPVDPAADCSFLGRGDTESQRQ